MKSSGDHLELDGWRIQVEVPQFTPEERMALARLVAAIANDSRAVPMRRSRHASTYKAEFPAKSEGSIKLFLKVIDQTRAGFRAKWLRRSAASHVARVTEQLAGAGFHAPPLWIRGRQPSSGREMIVTPRAEGDGPLRTLAALNGAIARKRLLLRALGAEIARLHQSGFVHGDLTPFNIFIVIDEFPRFIFLDHERTRKCFLAGRSRRQLRNLVQLGRFHLPGLTRTDRLRTLSAYAAAFKPGGERAMMRRVVAMLARRIRRDGGFAVGAARQLYHRSSA